jgi:hypothetical protein
MKAHKVLIEREVKNQYVGLFDKNGCEFTGYRAQTRAALCSELIFEVEGFEGEIELHGIFIAGSRLKGDSLVDVERFPFGEPTPLTRNGDEIRVRIHTHRVG